MDDIDRIIKQLNINFDNFTKEDFIRGLNIEMEHGTKYFDTNVTNDDLLLTAKIALAHLKEFPNYYNSQYGLPMFEKYLMSKL